MESGVAEKQSSYTYWVRDAIPDAAPLLVPCKLAAKDFANKPKSITLGSVWNEVQVRFSEEKDLGQQDKVRVGQDLKLFLQPIHEKLLGFEEELKDR